MPTVEIIGVGVVEFPDEMSEAEIKSVLDKQAKSWGGKSQQTQWEQYADPNLLSQIPPGMLSRWIQVESGGNPKARSPKGAMGLLQLMPGTAKSLGVTNAYDPSQNINAGIKYMRDMYDKYNDWRLAAMAYHAGPGNVNKWLAGKPSGVGERTLRYPGLLGF